MNVEIERKFLVRDMSFKGESVESHRFTQGYICKDLSRTVRIRLSDDKAYITIKGRGSESGMSRFEWEKEISQEDFQSLLLLCQGGIIDKTRYMVPFEGKVFEVDEFYGENSGLVVAEVELSSEDEQFARPSWLGEEVTNQSRYYNASLSNLPYSAWTDGCESNS